MAYWLHLPPSEVDRLTVAQLDDAIAYVQEIERQVREGQQ